MNALLLQLAVSLRLHFRNRMALIYSYLFPTIFLVAFWVLYRYETPPLVRHMGELLTVTILGGACFGLPTTMVSDRERGVWRRYRLTPIPIASIVATIVAARYLLLLTAGLVQLALAMLLGMPAPRHPFDLFVAFTCVSFGFLGLGLVIATMADNVPAVQALGQCIFLPMLIIGGVAVPLESLPEWAQHVSAFFPGRYAVDAIKSTVMGNGLGAARFSLVALVAIGAAGCLAGARLFRWDAQQRFASIAGKGWVAVALLAWAAVGIAAETRQTAVVGSRASRSAAAQQPRSSATPPVAPPPVLTPDSSPGSSPEPSSTPAGRPTDTGQAAGPARTPAAALPAPSPTAAERAASAAASTPQPSSASPASSNESTAPKPPATTAPGAPADWRTATLDDIDRAIDFTRVPPDGGVVTPIAPEDETPDPGVDEQLSTLRTLLPDWPPGRVPDVVQRTRNLLYVAAVPDVIQAPIERFAALEVYERLQQDIPKEQLIRALFWIALHPMEGDDSAVDQLPALGLDYGATDIDETRNRTAFYAVKLLGRLMGRIPWR
jgi:ABC-2 type transport system permease protein